MREYRHGVIGGSTYFSPALGDCERRSAMGPYLDVERAAAGSTAPRLGKVDHSAYDVDRKSNAEAINTLIQAVCGGLPITDEQLRAELEEGGDLKDVQSGALTPKALRLTAETLALMRYARIPT
jgi:hypothetical protein